MNQEQYGREEIGETRIIVPHLNEELVCIHPFLQGDYFSLARQIDAKGLQRPTMSETASLVKYGYANSSNIAKEIKKIMKNNWFYTFNGILYTPNGVLFQDNPDFPENAQTSDDLIMNEHDLQSRLSAREEKGVVYSDDGLVRFVPYGFKVEEQTYQELAQNPFVIALAGEEGAEKLAYIASQHKLKSYLRAFKSVKEPVKRVAALDSLWGSYWLFVYGDDLGDYSDGCSFGVRRAQK